MKNASKIQNFRRGNTRYLENSRLDKSTVSPNKAEARSKKSAEEMLRVEESDNLDLQTTPFKLSRRGSWDAPTVYSSRVNSSTGMVVYGSCELGKGSSHRFIGINVMAGHLPIALRRSLFWSQKSAVMGVVSGICFQPSLSINMYNEVVAEPKIR